MAQKECCLVDQEEGGCMARAFIEGLLEQGFIAEIPQEVQDAECHRGQGQDCPVKHFVKYDCEIN
ncbi:MAG: hypothetical protein V2A63_04640 [Patescibacteria group bacterium]